MEKKEGDPPHFNSLPGEARGSLERETESPSDLKGEAKLGLFLQKDFPGLVFSEKGVFWDKVKSKLKVKSI